MAGWFADYLKEQGNPDMESLVLEGGINGWVTGGADFIKLMDGYEEAFWK
jgi:arsenical-resistance protein 2